MSYGAKSELKVVEQHFNEQYGVVGEPIEYKLTGFVPLDETPATIETVLDEAKALVYGDREAAYSHPYDDFKRIGDVWSGYLGVLVTPQDVAQMMILLKACRVRVDVLHGRRPKHDTIVDEAGYAECAARVAERTNADKAA